MDDLLKIITFATTLLAIATAAGVGLQRGRIAQLQGRLKESDEELARVKGRHTEAVAELSQVKTDLAALARVVTGEAHWVAIGEKMDEHHTGAEIHWHEENALLEEIRDRLPPRST